MPPIRLPQRVCVLGLALSAALAGASAQVTLAPGFVQEELAMGLNPSTMALAPDGRIFVVDKGGRILIYADGALRDAPFLELEVDDSNERGLGGISFHPDFERNGWVYI